jgi:hypothetical protein
MRISPALMHISYAQPLLSCLAGSGVSARMTTPGYDSVT